jgi:hypothetical protein
MAIVVIVIGNRMIGHQVWGPYLHGRVAGHSIEDLDLAFPKKGERLHQQTCGDIIFTKTMKNLP